MRHWCGRHCFYLQLFGSYLVDARSAGQGQNTALANLQGESTRYFREIWRGLPAIHQQALRDAARGLPCHLQILQRRGLLDEEGRPFNELFAAWLRGEIS